MIQRIQSIYLLLAGLAIWALFLFPVAHNVYIGGVSATIKITGVYLNSNWHQTQVQTFTPLIIGAIIMGLLPIILIFLYKNRKRQVTLCYVYILLVIGFSYWLVQTVKSAVGGFTMDTHNFGIGALLGSISIILTVMAAKAIQKDEKLVRSADRLR
ncbi:MAG: DUF4293 domain-containing protein [Bacteroidetes bacterium]|nr:DUF4293 domain-containing protein [Bacteroidota bacterium]